MSKKFIKFSLITFAISILIALVSGGIAVIIILNSEESQLQNLDYREFEVTKSYYNYQDIEELLFDGISEEVNIVSTDESEFSVTTGQSSEEIEFGYYIEFNSTSGDLEIK